MMMSKIRTHKRYPVLLLTLLVVLLFFTMANAANIDATDHWAWGTNVGWINFNPTHGGGVTVYDDHLEGYVWAENVGWIRLGTYTGGGAHTYANDAADTYGVNHDGAGNLSGYAWGTNVGWINFKPIHGGVTVDTSTGDFDGYAWGENIGWIHFQSSSPAYKVNFNPFPDLQAAKDNDASGAATTGVAFNWTTNVSNAGAGDAVFADGQTIFEDELPSGPDYGAPTAKNFTDITNSGNLSCYLKVVSSVSSIVCQADGGSVTFGAGTGSFDVTFSVTPQTAGTLTNPKSGGDCQANPDGDVAEDADTNNDCSDTVTINQLGTVTLSANDASAAESPLDNGQFTVDLGTTNVTGSAITVAYSVDAGSTATSARDYNALSGSVQISDGSQTATIDLIPFDDTILEGDETVILELSGTDSSGVDVDTTPATVTISDDEQPTLTVEGAGNAIGTITDPSSVIACTSTAGVTSGDCDETAVTGTNFAVIASPSGSATFAGWTGCDSITSITLPGDTCNLSLSDDTTITAEFSDTTPPTVMSIELLDATPITAGGSYTAYVRFLVVTLSEDVLDQEGWDDVDDVTNPANFSLILNGTTSIPITMVAYDNNNGAGPYRALVALNQGEALPSGTYTFSVNGTTSITDYGNNSLDGDADGTDGDDYSIDFGVATPTSGGVAPDGLGAGDAGGGAGTTLESASELPATGFAPGVFHRLPNQPAESRYDDLGDLWLEIPSLGVEMPIIGVPFVQGEWDVTWLGISAGWLEGTAYPTWTGNTVLTGHVWDANNDPGPFAQVKDLRHGDKIVLHATGSAYTYEVRENFRVLPDDLKPLGSSAYDLLTLVTCEGYAETGSVYHYRRVVEAVLIDVEAE